MSFRYRRDWLGLSGQDAGGEGVTEGNPDQQVEREGHGERDRHIDASVGLRQRQPHGAPLRR